MGAMVVSARESAVTGRVDLFFGDSLVKVITVRDAAALTQELIATLEGLGLCPWKQALTREK